MDISKLPIGTLLIWDAPELLEGYAAQIKSPAPGRVYYPAEIVDKHPTKGVLVRTGKVHNWMGAEQEYLRLPTDADLKLTK